MGHIKKTTIMALIVFFLASLICYIIFNHLGFTNVIYSKFSEINIWGWCALLFVFGIVLGIISVLTGNGGAVLFVPIASIVFPFHLDFIRATGLMIAMTSALTSSPRFLKENLASLRLSIPICLISSVFSILGAYLGFLLADNVAEIILGILVIFIAFVFLFHKQNVQINQDTNDVLSSALNICGVYYDQYNHETINWRAIHTWQGFILFAFIGLIAGMFGLGAGWANVPVLNMVMGVPLKVAAASSQLILMVASTSSFWVYFYKGAVLPIIVIPSIFGMMIGANIGARIFTYAKPDLIKKIIIIMFFIIGIKSIIEGLLG